MVDKINGNEDEIRSSGMKSGVLFSPKCFFMKLDNPSAAMDLKLNILVTRKKFPMSINYLFIGNISFDFFIVNFPNLSGKKLRNEHILVRFLSALTPIATKYALYAQ